MGKYLIYALDGTDEQALSRRMAAREEHLRMVGELREAGNFIMGGAMLDDEGKMIGSTLLMEFASRQELDAWLEKEPYLLQNVWVDVKVHPFLMAKK